MSQDGFIDLSQWDFEHDGIAALNGEWDFYSDVLLSPADFDTKTLPQRWPVQVPSRWVSIGDGGIMADQGIGTYRLKVKVNEGIPLYGLKTKNIRSAAKLFVNGIEAGNSGNPAASKDAGYETNVVPIVTFFPAGGDGTLDIVLQVANLDYYNGGIIQPVYLGSKDSILNHTLKVNIYEIVGIMTFLLSGIYYLGIFLNRRQDRHFLYSSLFCLTHAYITATDNEKIFNKLFDTLPFMWILKLKIAAICLSILVAALLIQEMGKAFIPAPAVKTIAVVMSVNAGLIIAAPVASIAMLEQLMGPLYLIAYATIAVFVFLAIRKKQYGRLGKWMSILLLGGILLLILSYASAFLYFFSVIQTYIPLWFLVFLLLGMGAMFVKEYSKAYDDLEAISHELIEADRLKDEFLIHTSHEFKTPLHGIMNMAQAVLDKGTGDSAGKQEETLIYIIAIAARLSSLVNDIIDVQSLKNNKLRLNPRSFDINGTVVAVLQMLKDMRKGDDIKLINRIPVGEWHVYADENRFKQIVVNLINNALKYTEKGYVEINAEATDGNICIRVVDTGIGMDAAEQEELFKGGMHTGAVNFSNAHSSGLGLSISRMLAARMDGELYLEYSEPHKGSSFVLKLPQAMDHAHDADLKEQLEAQEKASEHHANEIAGALGENCDKDKRRILIVDDEPSNIKVLKEIFHADEYEILVAYNGYRALELIKGCRDLSIVLLDVMMPGLSGYEVCTRIREEYELFELPILLMTVRNTPQDVAIGLEAGANDFVVKPFDAKELKARVQTLQKMKEAVGNAIKMESVFLQSQIQPHFLYNALNIIISLCHSDGPRAGHLLEELSNYLRCSFDIDPHHSIVSLKTELSLVNSYVELEKARFEERLSVEFDIEERALGCRIPALTLQPLVENAVRHGLMKRISGGTVRISAVLDNSGLMLTVADDGLGIDAKKLETLLDHRLSTGSIGLKNVHKRLCNQYGQGLQIESIAGKGTTVAIHIPVKYIRSDYSFSQGSSFN